ncbi:MAG: acyl-[acyl-carrier-protein] thioesterase [Halobacteriovoraceae bacterium]|jgi:acyl-ACP thioesterase|nr:acyl-[acyl-carrier-protein] thioesterase [Halobacteriovoraceae bacterium]|tara:strand:+ start:138377 stop:139129 length:753 start_codon:yes stop_codon:yes gene_type:complete
MKGIYSKDYVIDTFTSNSHKRLGLLGLVGILQDIATFHAKDAGFGHEEMLEKSVFWVLIRKSIKMKKWPALFSTITVKTWSRLPDSYYAYRDFEIYSQDELIGTATTTWVTLNAQTRRPTEIPLKNLPLDIRSDKALDYEASKVEVSIEEKDLEKVCRFHTRNSDLDLNGHVNNTKYSQWVLDSIDFQYHSTHVVTEYHINFLSEVKLGDEIEVYKDLSHSDEHSRVSYLGRVPGARKPSMLVQCLYSTH